MYPYIEGRTEASTNQAEDDQNVKESKMAKKKKDENEMTETVETENNVTETVETPKTKSLLKTTEVKQKLSNVVDLDNPDVTPEVTVVYNKYDFAKNVDHDALAKELDAIVTPISERNKALAAYAQSQSYQQGKDAAFEGHNYLTQELKTAIVDYLRMTGKFNENTAKEIFQRWIDGYKGTDAGKKASAKKILDRVTEAQDAAGDL